jgi:N6-adenosine-specific RNA methylase IME4
VLPTVDGGFGCILADPPWRFATWSAAGRNRCPDGLAPIAKKTRNQQRQNAPERHYRTMDLAAIKALPVGDVAARNAVLLLWVVDCMMPDAFEVCRAWGFTFKTTGFVWIKQRRAGSRRHLLHEEPDHKMFPMGTGYWTRSNPEFCLLATRGKPKRLSAGVRKLIVSPRREHSRKPDEQYDRAEALCAGPRLELFARQSRPGWSAWGDQVGVLDEVTELRPSA